jgi:hypothetical protein
MKKLTARQAHALRFIRDYVRLHGYSPSEDELAGYSRITDDEMKNIMKTAVSRVFTLLTLIGPYSGSSKRRGKTSRWPKRS